MIINMWKDLPLEIQEKILSNIDAKTLLQLNISNRNILKQACINIINSIKNDAIIFSKKNGLGLNKDVIKYNLITYGMSTCIGREWIYFLVLLDKNLFDEIEIYIKYIDLPINLLFYIVNHSLFNKMPSRLINIFFDKITCKYDLLYEYGYDNWTILIEDLSITNQIVIAKLYKLFRQSF